MSAIFSQLVYCWGVRNRQKTEGSSKPSRPFKSKFGIIFFGGRCISCIRVLGFVLWFCPRSVCALYVWEVSKLRPGFVQTVSDTQRRSKPNRKGSHATFVMIYDRNQFNLTEQKGKQRQLILITGPLSSQLNVAKVKVHVFNLGSRNVTAVFPEQGMKAHNRCRTRRSAGLVPQMEQKKWKWLTVYQSNIIEQRAV